MPLTVRAPGRDLRLALREQGLSNRHPCASVSCSVPNWCPGGTRPRTTRSGSRRQEASVHESRRRGLVGARHPGQRSSGSGGSERSAGLARLRVANFLVADLLEVLIPEAHGPERLGRGRADAGICELLEFVAGGRGRGGDGNQDLRRPPPPGPSPPPSWSSPWPGRRPRGSRSSPGPRWAGGLPGRAALAASAPSAAARYLGIHQVPGDPQPVNDLVVDDHDPPGGDRTHGQLFLPGRAQLPHQEDVERHAQRRGPPRTRPALLLAAGPGPSTSVRPAIRPQVARPARGPAS